MATAVLAGQASMMMPEKHKPMPRRVQGHGHTMEDALLYADQACSDLFPRRAVGVCEHRLVVCNGCGVPAHTQAQPSNVPALKSGRPVDGDADVDCRQLSVHLP